ncbi:acyl-CoA dehydrogenase [Sphingomonas sp. OV641]|uniref:acyl-CoA dehydrogenase family protein n=1 Tax=Sphingomonas sp. OV641 TaxID=1881068 RepID=UPI0008CC2D45|nr:acyl-CoA dehydrogenase family protein [Sphingomonas sp. OV641]SEJ04407.1 acyl-CoA dehydrogenase [Sphingomonas sp. OV641]
MEMNDVGAMLADTAERLFTTHASAIDDAASEGVWPDTAWAAIEESGLPLALVPEEHGGFGIPAIEALALIRQTGRHALALPLAETIVANAALAAAGLPLAEGPVGLAESSDARVPWGRFAQTVVVASAGGVQRYDTLPVPAESANLAGHPRDRLAIPAGQTEASGGVPLLELGALARALQMAGALERVLELTVEHVSSRVQFGRPLAKFQAIQQELAKLAGEVAAASAAADHVADAYASGGDLSFAVAVARTRIGEAASKATAIGHQLHGAIGFTREHSLHRFTTALWAWRDELGTQRHWTLMLGKRALSAGRDGYWPMVVAA